MKVSDVTIDDEYVTVNGEASILEVAKTIAKSGIPDVVVIDNEERVLGALDDYDIVSKVVAEGQDPNKIKAKDIMFAPPPIKLDTELEAAHEIMEELKVTVLPVVGEGRKLMGVLTIMDVLEGKTQENDEKGNFLTRILGL